MIFDRKYGIKSFGFCHCSRSVIWRCIWSCHCDQPLASRGVTVMLRRPVRVTMTPDQFSARSMLQCGAIGSQTAPMEPYTVKKQIMPCHTINSSVGETCGWNAVEAAESTARLISAALGWNAVEKFSAAFQPLQPHFNRARKFLTLYLWFL